MSDAIISVENLGKKYQIKHQVERQRYTALRDVIAQKMKAPFHFFRSQKSAVSGQTSDLRPPTSGAEDFWALKDVSFEVKRGEVVGIIGRNGAGKSTLLKILSRITEPTEGQVTLKGRVASLLEVGTGFHPELTGRENIFLNGAILGMHRAEIKRKFDEIVAFAEVEKFLDTPVKRYSSGMYVRLAFAVAAHLEPEILIVDEVLAVGDAEFQKKCLGKMQEVSKSEGRTVLFVSHNMAAVQSLCTRGICLKSGTVSEIGDTDRVVANYLRQTQMQSGGAMIGKPKLGAGLILDRFDLTPSPVASGNLIQFHIKISPQCPVRLSELAVLIYTTSGFRVAVLDFRGKGVPRTLVPGDSFDLRCEIPSLPLVEGDYSVGLYVNSDNISDNFLDLATLGVSPKNENNRLIPYPAVHRGVIELPFLAT